MNENIVKGSFVSHDCGEYYKIENTQEMPAFFINIATSSDVWAFLSSNGALTAGRQNAAGAVFPYETDDRLHLATSTGPKTLLRFEDGRIWEPFNTGRDNPFAIRRNLYKRLTGDAVLFEEINDCLDLTFYYRWETGEKYGLVRTAGIKNNSGSPISMDMLDGVENIMPFGITQDLADSSSCLTDGYKVCERLDGNLSKNLTVFSLTSIIIDTPEPVEVLRANVAWRIGSAEAYLLSAKQMSAFASGKAVADEADSFGSKGAYLSYQRISLESDSFESWMIVLDARLSQKQISELRKELIDTPEEQMLEKVKADIIKGTAELTSIVAAADGLQKTADSPADVRHYMNVLNNNMRGGIFTDGYKCNVELFERFVASSNRSLAKRRADFFDRLRADGIDNISYIHELAYADGDADLIRLALEFLPLSFSRRHGDPSRPWNRFHLRVKDDSGNRIYHYEGNWRDIFQNWEAMSLSFPAYIAPMIAKFLNASTVDGFNPYRITYDGVDWEVPQPDNPFSGYGYWGDHQIVYLNKLLEWLDAYAPEQLDKLLVSEIFTYTNIPYEIKPYKSLLKNGKDTIDFNLTKHEQITKKASDYGSDAKLLFGIDDGCKGGRGREDIYHVSFMEKLLVPILSKLSNLVIGGGVWMNTQRPEWNDANNAIVGYGLSMVTVYQLYRHLQFCVKLIERGGADLPISNDVSDWLTDIHNLMSCRSEKTPREFLDEAGVAFEHYRFNVYSRGFVGKCTVKTDVLQGFFKLALETLAETIDVNLRSDGMYNTYNILHLTPDSLEVSPMFLMLEGQTAVLGSGRLKPSEALNLALNMETGGLMSDEHDTFFLYPVKKLKTFMERNIIPEDAVSRSGLLVSLLADGHDGFVLKDAEGNIRFHDSIRQSSELEEAMAMLFSDGRYKDFASEADLIREIYEIVFAHREFTGRSGIMYKYEGIGSIYWHQNSKFILSFQEVFSKAARESAADLGLLKDEYYRLRAGLGFNKEPSLWGAFPLEPYSHTPYGMPAQQPGMTGQVKEDILTRNAEIGISVREGVIHFEPALLRQSDFLKQPAVFKFFDVSNERCEISLGVSSLAFTICQTPVVYTLADEEYVVVNKKNGETLRFDSLTLDASCSNSIFSRDGDIQRIDVVFGNRRMV